MHRRPGKYSPPPCSPDVRRAGRREHTRSWAGTDAGAHPGFVSPRCAVPYDNGAPGLIGSQRAAGKGPWAVRNTDSIRRLKSACKPLHFYCHHFHSPLWFQMDITRSEMGSIALLPCLFQLVRAHRAFWGTQAKSKQGHLPKSWHLNMHLYYLADLGNTPSTAPWICFQ